MSLSKYSGISLRKLFFVIVFFVIVSPLSSNAESIETLVQKFNEKRFSEIVAPLRELASDGESHAQFLLAVMYYFGEGVEVDRELAFSLFRAAAFNPKTDGHNKAAEFLARSYLMDPKSKHYNKEFGLRVLRALSDLGEVESQLYMGGFLVIEAKEKALEKEMLLKEAFMHFDRAANQHAHAGAHFMLFILQKDRYGIKSEEAKAKSKNLQFAAENRHQFQADAAIELAFYLRDRGEFGWEKQYIRWLEIAADLKKPEALYFLGKAVMFGMVGEQDYLQAKSLLSQAVQLGHAQSSKLLADLQKRVEAEQRLDTFEVPLNWIDSFLAIQSFAGRETYNSSALGNTQPEYSPRYEFDRKDTEFFSASGMHFRKSGRRIVGSDGSQFSVTGNSIQNLSTGTTYRYSPTSNSLMGTNGVKYNFRGKSIYGTDGSVCTTIGKTVSCY